MVIIFKPNANVASDVKKYEVDLLDEEGNEQSIILHRKKLLLFKPKDDYLYIIKIRGKDKNGNIVAESVFSAKE
jgi:hypothetical protein